MMFQEHLSHTGIARISIGPPSSTKLAELGHMIKGTKGSF